MMPRLGRQPRPDDDDDRAKGWTPDHTRRVMTSLRLLGAGLVFRVSSDMIVEKDAGLPAVFLWSVALIAYAVWEYRRRSARRAARATG